MDDAALKDEVNVRFSAAHLLQALEEERRDAAAATPAPTGDDLDALLARIDNLHAQVDAATEERRAAAARQASLQSEMRDSDAARTAAVAELAALRDARDDAAHAHERELAEFRRRLKENTDRKRAAEVSARAKLRAYETDAAESAAVAAETARKVAASHARKMSGLEESARQAAVRAAAEHATNQATLTEMAADLATSQAWIASLQEQAETSACARAEASEAHSMALDALHSAHKEHLAGTSHRLKKDAAVALEHHAASLQSEHDAVLEGAMRKAKAESDAVKDEWNRERRDTHLEHTRELDRMHEGIAQLHSELVATEASLAQETSQVKALRESLSETATHEATARDTLEAFTEQYTAWRRKQSDDVAELRALHLERETALETAIAQADKDSTAFQTALEASADATVRQLKQEKEDACADLKYAHAQELKCNAALTEEAHQALQRVANDMLQLQTITHAGTRAQTPVKHRSNTGGFLSRQGASPWGGTGAEDWRKACALCGDLSRHASRLGAIRRRARVRRRVLLQQQPRLQPLPAQVRQPRLQQARLPPGALHRRRDGRRAEEATRGLSAVRRSGRGGRRGGAARSLRRGGRRTERHTSRWSARLQAAEDQGAKAVPDPRGRQFRLG